MWENRKYRNNKEYLFMYPLLFSGDVTLLKRLELAWKRTLYGDDDDDDDDDDEDDDDYDDIALFMIKWSGLSQSTNKHS